MDGSGKPIPYAHVLAGDDGAVARENGEFVLITRKPADAVQVKVTSIGYKVATPVLKREAMNNIVLEEDLVLLNTVVISPDNKVADLVNKAVQAIPRNYSRYNTRLDGRVIEEVALDSMMQ